MKNIVVGYDKIHAIGRGGDLPWAGDLPADMKYFRNITSGGSVIMGRKTFESLPKAFRPLPNRQNIVLSLGEVAGSGFQTARSLEEAYALAERDETYVIGGGRVYEQALPTVDRIYATEIDTVTDKADTFFPVLDPNEWTQQYKARYPADDTNKFGYAFVTYLRNHSNHSIN